MDVESVCDGVCVRVDRMMSKDAVCERDAPKKIEEGRVGGARTEFKLLRPARRAAAPPSLAAPKEMSAAGWQRQEGVMASPS